MKTFGQAFTALLVLALPLTAQNLSPTSVPGPPASPERLDALLRGWEERMSSLESFSTRITTTEVHGLSKKTKTLVGEAAFMKPTMARLDLTEKEEVGKKDTEKTNFVRLVCNGKYIYEYTPREKKIIVHEIPKNNPVEDNMILSFLRGMKAAAAKQRFDITLTKEDERYAYLLISPKNAADKQEFAAAELTIWIKNLNPQGQPNLIMMPCRLWYRQQNGTEVTYMFSDMQPNARLDKETFVPRQIPGYKVIMAADKPTEP